MSAACKNSQLCLCKDKLNLCATLQNRDGTAAVTPATPTPIAPTPTMPTPTTQMPSTATNTIYDPIGIKDGQDTHLSEELSSEIKDV